ncbi:MAG: 3-deoxy-8-phosphooctulonate synthase [Bacteroidota bacterium]
MPQIKNSNSGCFFLIAGPCVVESEAICFSVAEKLTQICDALKVPFIFKASFKKANRSRLSSYTGMGDIESLKILKHVSDSFKIPVLTDIHLPEDAALAAEYVDVLQIPAFLSRQTDLLLAAGKTGKVVNIKKGQFLSGASMKFAAEKILSTGNQKVMLTERGTTFGYNDLVVDFRNIYEMKKIGFPVILDVTHSIQQPNQADGVTGGNPDLIETLAKAGIAAGVDGLFFETHPDPSKALSDGANMITLQKVESLLSSLVSISNAVKK